MKTMTSCVAVLLLASGLALGACGSDDAAEPEPTGDVGGEHEGEGSGDPPAEEETGGGEATSGDEGGSTSDTPAPEGEAAGDGAE